MKKIIIIILTILLCGCQKQQTLICKYIDQTSLYGEKTIIETITFNNETPTKYKKNINFKINNIINEKNKIYKLMKIEAKTLKKYIKGNYKIIKQNNNIIMNFTSYKNFNLHYITTNKDYETIKKNYESIGFECK